MEDKGKASKGDIEAARGSQTEMYIGFDKSDTAPRKGRKGRLVQGNPEDYPDRTDFTGGWAGGEKGLQQFIKQYEVHTWRQLQTALILSIYCPEAFVASCLHFHLF